MMLSFEKRLNCKYSYATEESTHLLCDIDNTVCDGVVYDCCLWNMSFTKQMEILEESEVEE